MTTFKFDTDGRSVLIVPGQTRALEYDQETACWVLHIFGSDIEEPSQTITCESMAEMRDVLDLCDLIDQMYSPNADAVQPVPRCCEEAR